MFRNLSFVVKLMLVLALTVMIAVGTLSFWVHRAVGRVFQDYITVTMRPQAMVLAAALGEAYAATGNWGEAGALLKAAEEWLTSGPTGRGMRRMMPALPRASVALVVADNTGRVVADSSGEYVGKRFGPDLVRRGQPILVNGRAVGHLLTVSGPREREFGQNLNRLILLAGGIASVAALVLGLLLTESVARPLRAVRDAAQRIGSGELSVRVPLNSDDEVGDLAEAFNQMATDLERNEQQRRTMMADIAHELRTPLAVIRGQVEALEDGVFPLTHENLEPIRDQSLLLARLVDDLRDLALAEAGRLPLECDEMDVAELVQRMAAAFRPQAVAKGITLALEGGALPTIWADAQRIEQVLANLLSNAIRHTPEGGRVSITLSAEAGQLRLSVQDSGPGIAPEDLPHLFDRFCRADKSRSRAEGGTGLGLSIARRLAQAHGGDITVTSAPGQGADFTVTLPAMGCRDRADADRRR